MVPLNMSSDYLYSCAKLDWSGWDKCYYTIQFDLIEQMNIVHERCAC
jgi:hypothetical protein